MINDFPYVDHIIHEVLRMYPPAPRSNINFSKFKYYFLTYSINNRVERGCNKDVTYDGVHIKKGIVVTVPIFALHYDEEYYPDPYTFNPDRCHFVFPINLFV